MRILTLILAISLGNAFADEFPDFLESPNRKGEFEVQETAPLKKILHFQVGLSESQISNNEFILKIIEDNPQIKNFDEIKKGEKIKLEYPRTDRIARYRYLEMQKTIIPPEKKRSRTTMSVFYMTGQGSLEDETRSGVTAISNQNAPGITGIDFTYKIQELLFLDGRAFLSQLLPSRDEIFGQLVNFPSESGAHIHLNLGNPRTMFTPFVGVDYENLYSFNTNEIAEGSFDSRAVSHQVYYVSGGISKALQLGRVTDFNLKLSYARSALSESDTTTSIIREEFSGGKIQLHGQLGITRRLSLLFFYKRNDLRGPSKLTINRYGAGISFRFF